MSRFLVHLLFRPDDGLGDGEPAPIVEPVAPVPVEPVVETEATEPVDWAPYEELGLHEVPVESLESFLGFMQGATDEDPDTARGAITALAESLGIDLAPAPAESVVEAPEAEPDPVTALAERLDARDAAEAQTLAEHQAREQIDAEWTAVQEEHGKEFTPKELEQLQGLAVRLASTHDEPIRTAYDLIRDARGDAEAARVDAAPNTPSPAVPAGHPSTGLPDIDDFDEAQAALIARRSGS